MWLSVFVCVCERVCDVLYPFCCVVCVGLCAVVDCVSEVSYACVV